jgi:DNA-binding winged helix-turn-helix (wHTH) protein/tetratricopeptide (TPR) repeat protein
MFVFGSFQLDVANASLRRAKQALVLTPKAFNVLRYLVEHAGQLVTRDELWRAVWPGVVVTEAALTVCVGEIRKALRDEPKTPRYIETVHRLGYRFIAGVSTQPVQISDSGVQGQDLRRTRSRQSSNSHFVGRETELAQLHQWLELALAGARQIVFVTGEPGIGKTTLVEQFLQPEQVSREERLGIGRGQCIEHYGTGEAYLPVLEALGRLCREPGGGRLVELLDKYAPTWLVQMPALLGATEWRQLQEKVAGATRARMLRELAETMEVISCENPLVLLLEDLHWSDYSTLEWLSFLARRQESARLFVLGTYRPVEVIVREHPLRNLKHELQMHGQCKELLLVPLREAGVMQYLAQRFAASVSSDLSDDEQRSASPAPEPLRKLAHAIYQRTDGNPLFMVNVVDYLAERAGLKTFADAASAQSLEALGAGRIDAPPSIIQMIELNLERLTADEQAVLETASVAGIEFPIAAVAAALQRPIEEIEVCCTRLARRQQFVHSAGTVDWPDGTVAARVQFLHGLYREVLYHRVPPGRRVELHRRVAEREEVGWGERAPEIAAELAHHYIQAGQIEQALRYAQLAAERALRRDAYLEAAGLIETALKLLDKLPEGNQRLRTELALRTIESTLAHVCQGSVSQERERAIRRMCELGEKLGERDQLLRGLIALAVLHFDRGESLLAYELAKRNIDRVEPTQEVQVLVEAHYVAGLLAYSCGYLQQALVYLDDAQRHVSAANQDDKVSSLISILYKSSLASIRALPLQLLGWPDEALKSAEQGLRAARDSRHLFGRSGVLAGPGSIFRRYRREPEIALAYAEEAITLSQENGFSDWLNSGRFTEGWALAELGQLAKGVAEMEAAVAGSGHRGRLPFQQYKIALIAQAYARTGRTGAALTMLNEALAQIERTGERVDHAEILRLKGEVLLMHDRSAAVEAENCFRASLGVAQAQEAKWWELRTSVSLARLLRDTNRRDKAHTVLGEIYNWFTEGFDTIDLREAKLLLDELS